jgi:hypothetical protein
MTRAGPSPGRAGFDCDSPNFVKERPEAMEVVRKKVLRGEESTRDRCDQFGSEPSDRRPGAFAASEA